MLGYLGDTPLFGKEPGTGAPPPLPQVWTDKQTENIIFPHPLDAGGKKLPKRFNWYRPSVFEEKEVV